MILLYRLTYSVSWNQLDDMTGHKAPYNTTSTHKLFCSCQNAAQTRGSLRTWHQILLIGLLEGIGASLVWGRPVMAEAIPEVESHAISSVMNSTISTPLPSILQQADVNTPDINYNSNPIYLAAPENLNPGLYIPPPAPVIPEPVLIEPVPSDPIEEDSHVVPFWQIEELTVNFSDEFSNFGQNNRIIEPTVTGLLPNGDRLAITTGVNSFDQPNVSAVLNVPLEVSWTRTIGKFTTTVGGGIDTFDNLPVSPTFHASTSFPLGNRANLSFFVEHGPYKFNTTTLNNQITSWRYGPNVYWQIAPNTSLFSLLRLGHYNDGNFEQQSFSRLEQKFGDFSIAANVFNWIYQENVELTSGYFSPPDFVVANGELAWQDDVFDWLNCRVAGSWGQQRLSGDWTSAFEYRTRCTLQMSETLEMDVGYSFSNVVSETGGSAFNNRAITGQIRAQF